VVLRKALVDTRATGCKTQQLSKIVMFLGSKLLLVRRADNLTAIYEPIV
jgi:hypothetical protein